MCPMHLLWLSLIHIYPATSPEALRYILDKVDLVLVMTVNPGFGGQAFIPQMLEKIACVRRMIDESGYAIDLEVDGGIVAQTARQVAAAGANVLVAVSYTHLRGEGRFLNTH